MFCITTKTRYGVSAVIELAKHHGYGLVKIKDIVERHDIPKNYLEQIFNRLHKQGVIKSTRGNKGGYELAFQPDEISLLQVIEALEGELQLSSEPMPEAVGELLEEVVGHSRTTLNVPLAEIVSRQRQHEDRLMYHI